MTSTEARTAVYLRPDQVKAVTDVLKERGYQDVTFGVQRHDLAWWQVILTKQVGQIADRLTRWRWGREQNGNLPQHIRRECIQTAAVALAMVESIDRGDYANEITTAVPSDKRKLSYATGVDDEHLHARQEED